MISKCLHELNAIIRIIYIHGSVQIICVNCRRIVRVAGRKQIQHLLRACDCFFLIGTGNRNTALLCAVFCTAQRLGIDCLAGNCAYHLRSINHQTAHITSMDGNISKLCNHCCTAAYRTENHGNHGAYTAQTGHFCIDGCIGFHSGRSLINSDTGAVAHGNNGGSGLQCHVQKLVHFLSMKFTHSTAVHGVVLCKYINRSSLNRAIAGHYPGIIKFFCYQHSKLNKTALIKQLCNALPGSQLTVCMLFGNTSRISVQDGLLEFLRISHFRSPSV